MTENKRFVDDGFEAIDEQSFTDTETDKTYYVDYFDEIIDLANGLNEKNKLLYKEIERLRTQNEDLLYSNAKNIELLEKENEQLKKDGLYWGRTAEARLKEIDKLRKDNSILKQQRDYLFNVIDEILPHSGSTTAYNRMQDIGDVE